MASTSDYARDTVLAGVRAALGRRPGELVPPVPALPPRIPPRARGRTDDDMAMLLDEIGKLGGRTQRVSADTLRDALSGLVQAEKIRKATLWQTPELMALDVSVILSSLGVEIIPAQAGKHALAQCDLGVTGVDLAVPETGTLGLRSSPDRPRAVSLLPRVHLALVHPESLRADLTTVLQEMRVNPYFMLITGPSRTADIEMTVTIGVHGPQVLDVWVVDL